MNTGHDVSGFMHRLKGINSKPQPQEPSITPLLSRKPRTTPHLCVWSDLSSPWQPPGSRTHGTIPAGCWGLLTPESSTLLGLEEQQTGKQVWQWQNEQRMFKCWGFHSYRPLYILEQITEMVQCCLLIMQIFPKEKYINHNQLSLLSLSTPTSAPAYFPWC